jgi:hypothetical protein
VIEFTDHQGAGDALEDQAEEVARGQRVAELQAQSP